MKRKQIRLMCFASVVMVVSGCSTTNVPEGIDPEEKDEQEEVVEEIEDVYTPLKISAAESKAIEAQQNLAIEIFGDMCDKELDENLVMSPLSATMAISVFANAIDASDATALVNSLGFSTLSELNACNKLLIEDMPTVDPARTIVSTANGAWFNTLKISTIDESFVQSIEQSYAGSAMLRNFTNKKDLVTEINDWAKENTKEMITNVMSEEDIETSMPMIIANALYFKGLWSYEFNKDKTVKAYFYDESGKSKIVDMMSQSSVIRLNYIANDEITAVKIPYGNGSYNMIVVLPNSGIRYQEALQSAMSSTYSTERVNLKLPKFEVNSIKPLTYYLTEAGINITGYMPMAKTSVVGQIFQTARIIVDESGSEAAAVTSMEVGATGAEEASSVKQFCADRPFCFIIEEAASHAVLFFGKVSNPNG